MLHLHTFIFFLKGFRDMRRFRKFLPAAANTANTELSGCFWASAVFPVVFKQQNLLALCRFQATVQMKKTFLCSRKICPWHSNDFFLHSLKLCYICIVHMHCY